MQRTYPLRGARRKRPRPAGRVRTLVTTGPGDDNGDGAFVPDASADLTRILFGTAERLLPDEDPDAGEDIYLWADGELTLVSPGGTATDFGSSEASADFTRVLFGSDGRLTADDQDDDHDAFLATLVAAPVNSAPPAISGTARVGQRLTCGPGSWTGGPSFTFRWNRDGAAITGATAATYVVAGADAGRRLTCTVTASTAGGVAAATSAAVTVPAAGSGPGPDPDPGLLPGACANAKTGTRAAETLTGTATGDRLRGRGGDDVLKGLGGGDCLSGEGGNDRLKGGGDDDRLTGGKAKDTFSGGGGNDRIDARDKRKETVRCGPGKKDRVKADRTGRLIGCEKVKRR